MRTLFLLIAVSIFGIVNAQEPARTITVRGTAQMSAKVDLVTLTMTLESQDMDYAVAMKEASSQINALKKAFGKIKFKEEDVKTADFNVRTDYKSVKNGNGYTQEFNGYVVTHKLKLAFDFDSDRLAEAISALSSSEVNPKLSVTFSVKDPTAINEELLRLAADNARKKAETLCTEMKVELGEVRQINYSYQNPNLISTTQYSVAQNKMMLSSADSAISIEPEDITVTDTVEMVWEIK